MAGDHLGRTATFVQFGRYVGETDGTFKATLQHLLRSDDGRVFGIHHNTAKRAGKELDVSCCIAFEVKNGRIISGREYFHDLNAGDEFWSENDRVLLMGATYWCPTISTTLFSPVFIHEITIEFSP